MKSKKQEREREKEMEGDGEHWEHWDCLIHNPMVLGLSCVTWI